VTVEAENQVRTAKVVKGLGAGKDVKGRRGNFLGHLMDEKKIFWVFLGRFKERREEMDGEKEEST